MSGGQEPQRTRISSRAIPSWLLVASVAVVVVAVIGFFVSGKPDNETKVADASATTTPSATSPTTTPSPQESRQPAEDKKDKKDAKKKKGESADAKKQVPRAFVEIFNNTKVKGLASSTSSQVQGAGWTVVGTDNWYGNIPATTIYYPERLEKQAEILADDLGIDRVRPAVDPMKFDRLTLILTGQV